MSKSTKEPIMGLDGFREEIPLGFSRNGSQPVGVSSNVTDGWMVHVGGATLRVPDVDAAFTVALGWITGRVRIMTRPYPTKSEAP